MSTAAFAALPAGRAMDRFGRVPVHAGGFALGILGCVLAGFGASWLSVMVVVFGLVLIGASYGTVMLPRWRPDFHAFDKVTLRGPFSVTEARNLS